MNPPDRDQILSDFAEAIDARVALTGRPREVYEEWVTRSPRPGQTWRDALYGRMESLTQGPMSPAAALRLRRQIQATRRANAA